MEIRDAVYGDIELLPAEVKLLDTFEMQRLRKVRTLALVNLAYPTAVHTRFDHSIGVRYCVQHIIERSHFDLPKEEKELLFKAALLHDIGHPCFSHITEELEDIPKHTKFVELMLQGKYRDIVVHNKILKESEAHKTTFVADVLDNTEAFDILRLIDKKYDENYTKKYLAEMINGYIDADNLDYVRRDGYFLGLPYGNFDDRIFSSFRLVQTATGKALTFSEKKDSISSIMNFLRARFELYRAAYRHHAVEIADAMLLYALEAWTRDNSDSLFILGDDELLSRMASESEKAREMILRLQSRQLYKRAYVINSKSSPGAKTMAESIKNVSKERHDFIQKLINETKIRSDDILLNLSRRPVWKEYGKISIGTEKPYELKDIAQSELNILEDLYGTIWNFSIYASEPSLSTKIFEFCTNIFGYKGEFQPKAIIAPIFYDTVSQVIADIIKEKKASLKVLNQLNSERKISSDDIGDILGISRSTASHYLTYIEKKFKERGVNLIKSKRINYKKFWGIGDPAVFERIKSEIKDYVL
ncbi:MAG TPA: HD domain-containing protein [Candidatus Methanoperedens sp.]